MNDLWNDIHFLSKGPPIQVVVLRGTGRAAEIALAGGCEGLARAIIALQRTGESNGGEKGRGIGLTKSVVRRD
jgi:hypothetical protein